MTIEEKSKAYDKAIEKIKYVLGHGVSPVLNKEDLQEIFPELSESEDEKVRKELIDAIQGLWVNDALPMPLSVKRKDEWLAWLEKQGEKKPAWSEEDEEMFDAIIADIQFTQKAHTHDDNQAVYEREIDWLKSLKQRIGG